VLGSVFPGNVELLDDAALLGLPAGVAEVGPDDGTRVERTVAFHAHTHPW
jgi:hypothetical protein